MLGSLLACCDKPGRDELSTNNEALEILNENSKPLHMACVYWFVLLVYSFTPADLETCVNGMFWNVMYLAHIPAGCCIPCEFSADLLR